ncbi:transporter substrate-binding domain-containing protein [Vibrio sp. Isolate25]|uniref:substrate-binding periplasmic protein n=1 Tax=Vibrio TaxID=662 RepID=UPI001EFD0444|nr:MULTISPECIES: transporter substrate-binding domain-containing protein [Vibrio]MCG9598047.1 transporter substrate-binding domain-containing protein [Vibrio sp. Isolate25]USD31584.1 transporter substrate-binding domain-containing protein [Vibrio sp. SCSIO 43186]USD44627.1 transporter substrate-binding domain-containing protein [Vibrio sp. SCSIO 43145]USD68707.1 transporter substrate-binding domain-containing protein [Vibrio sp. SCSIO 43139]USD96396.1 ABC transporter [Vibrio coralliilyticus]
MKWYLWLWAVVFSSMVTANQKIYMTSLEWPPYSGTDLPENGYSVAVAREAFAAMGYELVVDFQPWVRAVALASKSDKYVGYFPEYYFENSEFIFSDPIGSGPLGLVENTRYPVRWETLSDLKHFRIGVVQGYINTTEFDNMVKAGELQVEASANDARNIHKVAKGRLDVAVIDPNVLEYLISIDVRESLLRKRLRMNAKLLENKMLYMAFKNQPQGQSINKIFNQGLEKIDIESIVSRLSKSTD